MTEVEQKNSKRTAPKKINWSKAQRVAGEVTLMALSAFVSGIAMAAGQKVVSNYVTSDRYSDNNVLTIVKDRSAV